MTQDALSYSVKVERSGHRWGMTVEDKINGHPPIGVGLRRRPVDAEDARQMILAIIDECMNDFLAEDEALYREAQL